MDLERKSDRALVWLGDKVKTPPFSAEARREAGRLLRDVQDGIKISMPTSRPLPVIGARCHELRIWDAAARIYWRLVYRIDPDAIVILEVFPKKTRALPRHVIVACKNRLKRYESC